MSRDRATEDPKSKEASAATAACEATARLVAALCDRLRPPKAPPIQRIETHVSYVILTGARAYKIKKPLRLDFLDFSQLEQRRIACEDELRLNRRTAPELYLRVVPITGTADAPQLEGDGQPIEYAVEMRQFDPEALLATRVEQGTVDEAVVDALAERVASFHASLARDAPGRDIGTVSAREHAAAAAPDPSPTASPTAVGTARRNLGEILRLPLDPSLRGRIERLATWLEGAAVELGPILSARERGGFVRECHGDLHLANVALIDGLPVLFDCLEFDRALRTIDVIDEVSFAFMDFAAHGRRDLGYRFLNGYLEVTGDYEGVACLRFFVVHRALVRTKVALLRGGQTGLEPGANARIARELERVVAVAEDQAAPPRPRLVMTCGLAGSGKTTVSSALAPALGALRIRSDVERKRMAGLAATARSDSPIGGGLYAREGSQQTYARLESLAQTLLTSGQSVVVDASFLVRRERDRFRELARRLGVRTSIVVCEAPVAILRARVEARRAAGRDASEADAAVLEHQLTFYQPPTTDEGHAPGEVVVISTDRRPEDVREACLAFAKR